MKQKLSMKEDEVYLKHMLEAIEGIEGYIGGCSYESFLKDKKTVDAVVRELEIVGEASNKLSDKFVKNNLVIPLRDIVDMRNVLIHEYFGINTKIVWNTCKIDLPSLKKDLKKLLS